MAVWNNRFLRHLLGRPPEWQSKNMSEKLLENSAYVNDAPDSEVKIPILGSNRNMLIIFCYSFMATFGSALGSSSGIIWYLGKFGLSVLWIQCVGMISSLAATYTQVYIGYIGDKLKSKYGRRKPFVVLSFVLIAFSVLMLSVPASHSPVILVCWYMVFSVTYNVGSAIGAYPYSSWIIESSANGDDYLRINTLAIFVGGLLGGLFGIILADLLPPVVSALTFCLLGSITTFCLVYLVPNRIIQKVEKQPDLIPSMRLCFRTKEFQYIIINKICIYTASGIFVTSAMYLLIIGFHQVQTAKQLVDVIILQAAVAIVGGVAMSVFCNWLLRRVDKLDVYLWLTLTGAVLGVVSFGVAMAGSFILYFIIVVTLSVLIVPIGIIDTLFLRDLVLFDTFTTGLNRESMYQMALGVPSGLLLNLLTNVPVIIIYATGFSINSNKHTDDLINKQYSWTNTTIWELRFISAFGLTIIALISYYVIRTYPLRDSVAKQITTAVKGREARKIQAENAADAVGSDPENEMRGGGTGAEGLYDSVADNNDEMLMLHFSQLEVKAIVRSKNEEGGINRGLQQISRCNVFGMIMSVVAMSCLGAGVGVQLSKLNSSFIALLLTMFLGVSLYLCYEILRRIPIATLRALPQEAVHMKAVAQQARNDKYQETLQDLLARNGINDDGSEAEADASSSQDRNTVSAVKGRAALATPLKDDSESRLPGYKRIFSFLAALAVVGVLSAAVF